MKRSERWFCLAIVLVTFNTINGAAPFKKVALVTNAKGTTTTTTAAAPSSSSAVQEESFSSEAEDRSENGTASGQIKNSKLTGIPQIDYIWDPNLPRELRGYNLSSYPFFSSVPPEEDIHFKCDGLHDGFYASIEHKCQLYHHCVYGIRHDFLCANFTAFDQKTFICHFVSDVDCEGSQKYWNRNDDLYMATTTTSTTTTTTEPPPTTPRRRPARPLRPLRRPVNRRPLDDYYYDEEDEYDDDYYEEVMKRRRKQRPRHRKPVVDYEDEYEDEKRPVEVKPRRGNSRDRFRDEPDVEPEEEYEIDRHKLDRPKSRNKASPAAERRKISSRKPGTLVGRSNVEERRSLTEDRPISGRKRVTQTIPDESSDTVELPSRRTTGRKRLNERRTSSIATDLEDVDEYEKSDQEEAAAIEDEVPVIVKTTPKPLEEFITPKAAPSSVYARPRAPPRISRPVPMNEKKKFQYPVQKTGTTARPSSAVSAAQDDESEYYDEEEDYADIQRPRGNSRRRLNSETIRDDDDEILPPVTRQRKQKPPRTLRKPGGVSKRTTTTATPLLEEEEGDYDIEEPYVGRGGTRRKNNFTGRARGRIEVNDDVDFVDDDYDERPVQRSRPNGRKGIKNKPRLPPAEVDPEEFEEELEIKPQRGRANVKIGRRKPATLVSRTRGHTAQVIADDEVDSEQTEELDDPPVAVAPPGKSQSATSSRSAAVRVVKRPFLPSRGGSPYLPRGLQSVGVAMKSFDDQTTDRNQGTVQINMGSTISGVHLLEHGVPLLRESGPLRTTLPPRSPIPISKTQPEPSSPSHQPIKATLDELYETDYDVTLNDALNPTLKPLSPHQSLHHQQHYLHQANQSPNSNSNNNNRSYPNGVYSLSQPPQPPLPPSSPLPSETSFAYSSSNNQSPPSPVVINHHVHHLQLPSSSSQAQSSNHHLQVPAHSPPQTLTQTYHLHHRHPLPPQSQPHVQLQQQQQQQQQPQSLLQLQQQQTNESNNNNFNSDSYFSSTDIRRRTIVSAPQAQPSRYVAAYNSRIGSSAQQQQQKQQQSQNYYDEYEY